MMTSSGMYHDGENGKATDAQGDFFFEDNFPSMMASLSTLDENEKERTTGKMRSDDCKGNWSHMTMRGSTSRSSRSSRSSTNSKRWSDLEFASLASLGTSLAMQGPD